MLHRVQLLNRAIANDKYQDMQQASKPQQNRKCKSSIRRLLLLAGLSLVSIITWETLPQEQVRASDRGSATVANRSSWQKASFPVEQFRAYTSGFGYRRSPYGRPGWELHRGLDIAAPDGSYIRNWWDGQVIKVSDNTLCGTSITIQSGQWKHIYCHMKGRVETSPSGRYIIDRDGGIQIWEGQGVPSGARIGRVGMTGRTTGPHLHWGIKYADQYIDPAMVLRAMYAERSKSGSASNRNFR